MRRIRPRLLVGLALALAAAVGGTTLPAGATPPAPMGLEGIPSYSHLFVLILENENFDKSWGPASVAHYLNSLRSQGVFDDQYYATGHASLDNYIAMVSGQPDNPITGPDCETVNFWTCVQVQKSMDNGRNLADQMDEKNVSWKGYMDSMPSPCFHANYSPTDPSTDPYQGDSTKPPAGNYADRHNPFIYFPDIVDNQLNPGRCAAHVVPYTQLATDLAAENLPQFGFITPDTCHDGHDTPLCSNGQPGGLTSADLWLSQNVPPLLRYLSHHNGLLLITFDENGFSDTTPPPGCCTGGFGGTPGFGGRVGLLALGARLTPGKVIHTQYDHMSLLRTIEDSFGISEHLNNASSATAMADLFTP